MDDDPGLGSGGAVTHGHGIWYQDRGGLLTDLGWRVGSFGVGTIDRLPGTDPADIQFFPPPGVESSANPDYWRRRSGTQCGTLPERPICNRSFPPPTFQVRSEGRKEGEPSENVHSSGAMTEPTSMYSRRFSEGSPFFLPGV